MVMTPFGIGWFVLVAVMLVLAIGAHRALRGRDAESKRRWLLVLALLTWACSTLFTFQRAFSGEHPEFPISRNLPFHFCTVVQFLLIPGVWLQRGRLLRPLRAMLFFPGTVAAFLALCSPAAEYLTPIPTFFSWTTLFYVVHSLNVIVPVLMVSLGFYRPRLRDAFLSLAWFVVVAMIVLPITVGLRAWVNPTSNYFYFFDPEGAGILVMLWDWIGIPVLYQAPLLPIILPVLLLVFGIYRGVVKAAGEPQFVPLAV
jgi:uncharacterized membrane protein YwaF